MSPLIHQIVEKKKKKIIKKLACSWACSARRATEIKPTLKHIFFNRIITINEVNFCFITSMNCVNNQLSIQLRLVSLTLIVTACLPSYCLTGAYDGLSLL